MVSFGTLDYDFIPSRVRGKAVVTAVLLGFARWSGARSRLVEIYGESSDAALRRRIERLFQRNEGSRLGDIPTLEYDS